MPMCAHAHLPGELVVLIAWYLIFLGILLVVLWTAPSWRARGYILGGVIVTTAIAWVALGNVTIVPGSEMRTFALALALGVAPVVGWIGGAAVEYKTRKRT